MKDEMTREQRERLLNNGRHVECCGYYPPENRCGEIRVQPTEHVRGKWVKREPLVCTKGPKHEDGHYDAVSATGWGS